MLFSIIVTIFNGEAFIASCIDSVLRNPSGNYELIIIDDGSIDNTGKICDSYTDRYDFVKCVHTGNQGIGNARQAGLDAASGDYIIFVDGDDVWEESFCLDKIEEEIKKSRADLYVFGYVLRRTKSDGNKDHHFTVRASSFEDWRDNQDQFLSYFPDGLMFFCWNKIFRRQCILDNNVLSVQQHMEDFRFVLDFLKGAKKVVFLPGEFYCHIKRGGNSLTSTARQGMLEGHNLCHHIFLSLFDKEHEAMINQIMASAYIGTVNHQLSFIERHEDEITSLRILDNINENDFAQLAFRHYHASSFSEKISFSLIRNGHFRALILYRKIVTVVKRFLSSNK